MNPNRPQLIEVEIPPQEPHPYETADVLYMRGQRTVWVVWTDGNLVHLSACDWPRIPGKRIPGKKQKWYRLFIDQYHCFDFREIKKKKGSRNN
jgi:phosphoglucomutase